MTQVFHTLLLNSCSSSNRKWKCCKVQTSSLWYESGFFFFWPNPVFLFLSWSWENSLAKKHWLSTRNRARRSMPGEPSQEIVPLLWHRGPWAWLYACRLLPTVLTKDPAFGWRCGERVKRGRKQERNLRDDTQDGFSLCTGTPHSDRQLCRLQTFSF